MADFCGFRSSFVCGDAQGIIVEGVRGKYIDMRRKPKVRGNWGQDKLPASNRGCSGVEGKSED
jgi:hypothetical protein